MISSDVTSSGHMSDTDVQGSSIDLCQIPSDCSAFLPKLLITFGVRNAVAMTLTMHRRRMKFVHVGFY